MWPMKPIEITLHPVDNLRLANLCGALDENIRQIETAFDVTIARRGERFTVHGESAQGHAAARQQRFPGRHSPHDGVRPAVHNKPHSIEA